jgi:2-phosphosulfolactate phosphatase
MRQRDEHIAERPPVLGGERSGGKIVGFDLGNSPSEYTPESVGRRSVIFTTTNGTQALGICGGAKKVLIGAFVNFSAVVRELEGSRVRKWVAGAESAESPAFGDLAGRSLRSTLGTQREGDANSALVTQSSIHLLCAGTGGRITREDVLFAGAVVNRLTETIVDPKGLNDEARIAQDVWRHAIGRVEFPSAAANQRLAQTLRDTQGGRNLMGMGLAADIADAAAVDRFDFAPVFDAATRRIVKPKQKS